jgi:hypothetical protein
VIYCCCLNHRNYSYIQYHEVGPEGDHELLVDKGRERGDLSLLHIRVEGVKITKRNPFQGGESLVGAGVVFCSAFT